MKWLYRLDYKYGRHYIKQLMTVIVAGMVAVYVLDLLLMPVGLNASQWLALSTADVMRGQVWRLVTFIFVPPGGGPFVVLINLYFYYMLGRMLESVWGGFKLNVYYLLGMLGAIAAAFASHFLLGAISAQPVNAYGDNYFLNQTLFFAFATIAPDTEFRLFFLIPLKAKWLALFSAALIAYDLFLSFFDGWMYGVMSLVALLFSLAGYLIFFGPTLINDFKERRRNAQNRKNWRQSRRDWRNKNNWR